MNPPVLAPVSSRRHGWLVFVLVAVLAVAALPVAVAWGVWSCLHTSADTTALRKVAIQASATRWERKVEVSVGRIPLALVRFGLGFAPLDPQARLALGAVRSAEASVFDTRGDQSTADRAAVLTAADAIMSGRGWDRLVGVINDKDVVAVFVPKLAGWRDELHACVLVMNGENLVVASVRADPEMLLELVQSKEISRAGGAFAKLASRR